MFPTGRNRSLGQYNHQDSRGNWLLVKIATDFGREPFSLQSLIDEYEALTRKRRVEAPINVRRPFQNLRDRALIVERDDGLFELTEDARSFVEDLELVEQPTFDE